MKKIVIAGGSGFIGQYLNKSFSKAGYEVEIISRQKKHINWNDLEGIQNALENAEILINLAGKSVDCRYTEKNKAEIIRSRVQTTQILGDAILKCQHPPVLWLNSSTGTIYRHEQDQPMTETQGVIGSGFSVEVAKKWEQTFFSFNLTHTRQVALRMAIVLGTDGGALKPLKNLVKFGLGGKQGNGQQMFSWLHIEDLKSIILFIAENEQLNGVINCSTPYVVSNENLMKTLRESMQVKLGLPSPAWLLKIGAMLIRTETELILKSRWVYPERLINAGFSFQYPRLKEALTSLI